MRAKACWLAAAAAVVLGNTTLSAPSTRERERIELGRRLFMDPAASAAGRFSCASCHDPEHGFSDRRPKSVDENGPTRRHSQTVLNLEDGVGMHWDGEFDRMKELLVARLAPPAQQLAQARALHQRHFDTARITGREPDTGEFGRRTAELTPPYYGPTPSQVQLQSRPLRDTPARRIARDGLYEEGFRRAFGSGQVTTDRLVAAMESYLLSLRSGESAYDRYVAGDPGAMDARARRGLALFEGKADCASCHVPDRGFADGEFHNTGVGLTQATVGFDGTVGGVDAGRGAMSFVAQDLAKFKTPGLRDVARRPPYMHDGSIDTLADVVRYYDRGGTPNGRLDGHIRPLGLTGEEVGDLVAFLQALTSDERPGIGEAPPHRPRTVRIVLHDAHMRPLRGFEVVVHPYGDRLEGSRGSEEPFTLTTSRAGAIEFPFPPWTHVLLAADGHELNGDRPIPDYGSQHRVLAVPKSKVLLRLVAPARATVNAMPATVRAGEVVFTRAREIRRNEALYTTRARPEMGWTTVTLDYQPGGGVQALHEIDMSGGETIPIDLRAE